MSLTVSAQPETRLTGRWLILPRGVWIGVVALALGLYLWSIPVQLAHSSDQISSAGLEQLQQAGLSLGFYAGYLTALTAIFVLVFSIVGAVIFWRKSDDWMGLFASLTLVLVGITNNSVLAPIGTYYPPLIFLVQFVTFLGGTCVFLTFCLFPDGRFVPRWIRWMVPLVVVNEALSAFRPDLLGNDWFFPVEMASMLFSQIYRYRRVSNTMQRQQTKWVVFSTAVGIVGILGVILYGAIAWPGGHSPTVVADLIAGTV